MREAKILCLQCSDHVWASTSISTSVVVGGQAKGLAAVGFCRGGELLADAVHFLEVQSPSIFAAGFMAVLLAHEQKIRARSQHGFGQRLASEQRIAKINWAQMGHALAVRGKPTLGRNALAILFFVTVLRRNNGISGTALLCPGATIVAASIV